MICNFYLLILRKNNSETYTTRRAWVQNCSELTMSSELWSIGLSLEENSSDPKNWYILMIFWNLLYGHPYVNSKDNWYLHHFQATNFSFPNNYLLSYFINNYLYSNYYLTFFLITSWLLSPAHQHQHVYEKTN